MKYIGTTETFDPAFVNGWDKNLKEANLIITKELNNEMIPKLVENNDKIILHHTVTGLGGTDIEPNVKATGVEYLQAGTLLEAGFPITHYVLRIDPIIPDCREHIDAFMLVLEAWKSFSKLQNCKIRCRVSIIDQYKHLSLRGLELPWTGFNAPKKVFDFVANILHNYTDWFTFESCAELGFSEFNWIDANIGCASYKDLEILGINPTDYEYPEQNQRAQCRCLAKKQILGVKPGRCAHQCKYCYWKEDEL